MYKIKSIICCFFIGLFFISCSNYLDVFSRKEKNPFAGKTFVDSNYYLSKIEGVDTGYIAFKENTATVWSKIENNVYKFVEYTYQIDEEKKQLVFDFKGIYAYLPAEGYEQNTLITSFSDIANYLKNLNIESTMKNNRTREEAIEYIFKNDYEPYYSEYINSIPRTEEGMSDFLEIIATEVFEPSYTVTYSLGKNTSAGINLDSWGVYDENKKITEQANGVFSEGTELDYNGDIFHYLEFVLGKAFDLGEWKDEHTYILKTGENLSETLSFNFSDVTYNEEEDKYCCTLTGDEGSAEMTFKPLSIFDVLCFPFLFIIEDFVF